MRGKGEHQQKLHAAKRGPGRGVQQAQDAASALAEAQVVMLIQGVDKTQVAVPGENVARRAGFYVIRPARGAGLQGEPQAQPREQGAQAQANDAFGRKVP